MLHTRWTLLEMRKDALQRDLPAPDEACARHYCLHQGVEAPDLATIKDFFREAPTRAAAATPTTAAVGEPTATGCRDNTDSARPHAVPHHRYLPAGGVGVISNAPREAARNIYVASHTNLVCRYISYCVNFTHNYLQLLDYGYRTQALAMAAWSGIQELERTSEYLLKPAGA